MCAKAMMEIMFWLIIYLACGPKAACSLDTQSCSATCNRPGTNETACNTTTGHCMYGCTDGYAGVMCEYPCGVNCQHCALDNNTADNTTTCSKCAPGYYRDARACTDCPAICSEDPDGKVSKCYEHNGACRIGCVGKKYGPFCDKYCSPKCVGHICNITGYCTAGCTDTGVYGGDCTRMCRDGCLRRRCHRSGDCVHGCNAGYFSPTCEHRCSDGCTKFSFITLHDCNQTNGHCSECRSKTIWGPTCNTTCPGNCIGNECDRGNGTCTLGCANKWFGENCSESCNSNCVNGTCFQNNGSCMYECKTGFWGNDCNEICPETCQNKTCARMKGSCTFGCQSKHYGETCELVCSPYCAGDTCDRVTGRCNGCVEQESRHGVKCAERCSENCKNKTCFQNNGTCVHGCESKWYSATCDTKCGSLCIGDKCNRDTGECDQGCIDGWYGLKCDRKCSLNCLNVTCTFNGTCEFGCREGFIGTSCKSYQHHITEDQLGEQFTLGAVTGAFTAAGILAVLVVFGILLVRRYHLPKRPMQASQVHISPAHQNESDNAGGYETLTVERNSPAYEMVQREY